MRLHSACRKFASAFFVALTLAMLPAFSRAEEPILAEDRLPSNVLFYITVPDIELAYEQFQSTAAGALIQDPSLEKFRAQLLERYTELQGEVLEKVGIPLSDLVNLFSGELSVAVLRPVGQPIGWATLIEIGENQPTLDALLLKAEASFDGEKVEKETEEIEGIKVTTCTVITSDKEDAVPVTFAYCVKEGYFLAGSDAGVLESVLIRWDGEHKDTFAGNQIYQEIVAKCSTDEDTDVSLIWYVDPVSLTATTLSMVPQTQNFAGMIYMPTLGLTGLKAIGGVFEMGTKDFDSVSRSMVYLDGPPSGVLKVFQLKNGDQTPPAWVPENAQQYVSFTWDIQAAYSAIESIYDSFGGPGKFALATGGLLEQSGMDLKLKPDVIDVLTGKVQLFYNVNTENPAASTGLVSLGVSDSAKGQKLVSEIFKLAGGAETSSQSEAQLFTPVGEGTQGAAAVQGNTIFISNVPDTIKTALSPRPASPLSASEKYKTIAKYLPGETSMLVFQDPTTQVADAYEKARNGEFDSLLEGKIDFSVLPPFTELSKYFTPRVGYYIPDEQGSIGVQFSLKKSK